VTQPDTLKRRGDAVRRFVSVACAAWTYILSRPEHAVEAARITLAHRPSSPLTLDIMVRQLDSYRSNFYTEATATMPICLQTDADWAMAIKNMEAAKIIPPGSKPSDYYTNDFIDLPYGKKIVGLD
jgi:hypothetical protein